MGPPTCTHTGWPFCIGRAQRGHAQTTTTTEIQTNMSETIEGVRNRKARLTALRVDYETFQFRKDNLTEHHVADLLAALKRGAKLPPMLVWADPESGHAYIVDGHHRYAAWMLFDENAVVDVEVLEGTRKNARVTALAANSPTKLAMTNQERQDAAWRLVCGDDDFSKREIAEAAGVGTSQVGNMRVVLRKYKEAQEDPARTWWAAKEWERGREFDDEAFDHDEWVAAEAAKLDARIGKELGRMGDRCPEAVAEVLERRLGSKLLTVLKDDLAAILRAHELEEDEDADY